MSAIGFNTGVRTDVDVDAILTRHKVARSNKFLLALACLCLFIGCFGGFTALQVEKNKVDVATGTAIELAEVAHKSDFCVENQKDPACIKAGEVIKDPSNVVTGAGNSVTPITIMRMSSEDYLAHDPLPAVLGLVTAPLVILRLQLNQQ